MAAADKYLETTKYLEAQLNFLVPTGERPVYTASVGGGDRNRYEGEYELRTVRIFDGRNSAEGFDLDRVGFSLVRHETKVTDFYDPDQVDGIYAREAEDLLKRVTGAEHVVVFDHTLRAGEMSVQEARKVREPVQLVHNDYTPRSAPKRVRDLLPPDEAEARLHGRFAIVNLWRSIKGAVEKSPLALCDARSLDGADLIATERRSKDRIGEIYQVRYNPGQRWFYFPRLDEDEVLLIKTFDSATDGRARLSVHSAFEDPTSPANAPERQSIETRCFVFFA
jgi:hypothetical protein